MDSGRPTVSLPASSRSDFEPLFEIVMSEVYRSEGVAKGMVIDLASGTELRSFPSPYFTALLWDELDPFIAINLETPLRRAVDFLRSAGCEEKGWCFFPDGQGYPADTDDTAVVADLLMRVGSLDSPAKVADLLRKNRRQDGTHYVWFRDEGQQRRKTTVDPIVDLNIFRFMYNYIGDRFSPPQSVRDILAATPNSCRSVYSNDPLVCWWFVCRLERGSLPQWARHARADRKRLVSQVVERSDSVASHPGLFAALAAEYRVMTGLPSSLYDQLFNEPSESPLFRHEHSSIGYCCPLLELAAMARAEYSLSSV